MEYGVGIHGEPGINREPLKTSAQLADTLLYTEADNNDLYWKLDYVLPAVSIAPGAHFCLPVTA